MAERMLHYDRQEQAARRGWNERFGEPLTAPRRTQNMQEDVNRNYSIDTAHAAADPMMMFEAQLAMMTPAAQAEVRATFPQCGDVFTG